MSELDSPKKKKRRSSRANSIQPGRFIEERRPMAGGSARGVIIAFGGLTVFILILTLVAFLTPGWRVFPHSGPLLGLVTYDCGSNNRAVAPADCFRWWRSRMPFEKATLAFMILAIIFQFACVGLFVLLFMSPNMNMAGAAAGAAFLSFVCLFCTVIIFGTQFQHKIMYMQSISYEMVGNAVLGYSYWITVAALVLALLPIGAAGAARAKLAVQQ